VGVIISRKPDGAARLLIYANIVSFGPT